MKNKLILSAIILLVGLFLSCEETTQPVDSNELRLVLKADKTSGTVPLTVNFTAEIKGDTSGLVGYVPDYFFFPGVGRTVIRYALPDTLQQIKTWSNQENYNVPGTYKVVLLYQGNKNNVPFDLWTDTLIIKVQ